ncbi:cyclin-like protein [Halteromyces radiatus]|uniref:cyclin-like protein n=1 Tax=Halteromyces radiatus TaxID=101107 RepID=UPI0022210C77|nr:cyclin-like protein [Halteromyces radiatus]KAI8075962.1 cyclin-like protein [Halteromyces radiatus]
MDNKPALYEESSQYRHWRFSPSQLWEIRQSCNEAAIQRVRKNIEEDKAASKTTSEEKEPVFITADEQVKLCRYYEEQIQVICPHLKLSDMVMATALIYMKRFFLRNTMMDYHPKDILFTCLFMATKSESERISISDFGKNLQLPNTDMVLSLEFTVSQGLQFEYMVHHPYRAAYGYYLDIQHTGDPIDLELLQATYNQVGGVIKKMLLTDLPLIYQPSQLAIAAFIIAGQHNGFDLRVKRYLEQRLDKELADTLYTMTILIDETLIENAPVPLSVATEIDARLRSCKNPAKNPESAL